MTKPAFAHIAS